MKAGGKTPYALLGILSLRPMSGYEIRQMMARSTENFWSESFGQIYPGLKSLVAQGFANVELSQPDGHRMRKVYRLTTAGRECLRSWLGLPSEPQVERNELLLRLFFGVHAAPGVMRAQVESRRGELEVNLARYLDIERYVPQVHQGNPAMPFFLMTVRYGIAEARSLMTWCDETLQELRRMEQSGVEQAGIAELVTMEETYA